MAIPPSFADLFDAAEREILIRPTAFNPAIVRTDGSDVNVAVAFAATCGEEVSRYAQSEIGETYAAIAAKISDAALDRWAYDRYQQRRFQARSALATLVFTRTGNNGFTIPAGTKVSTGDGQVFSTLTDVPFGVSQFGPLSVVARADQTGLAGNVDADTLTNVSGLEDQSTAVVNPDPAAGGREAETNQQFLARLQRFFPTARRGTRAAIENGCLDIVSRATVIELLDSTGSPDGRVQAIIADDDGQANEALANEVLLNLEEYRGLGVPVVVFSGTPELIRVQASNLAFTAGVNTTEVLADARLRAVARINALAPGETLRLSVLYAALDSTPGLIVPQNAIEFPAGDLVPEPGRVIRSAVHLIRLNGI